MSFHVVYRPRRYIVLTSHGCLYAGAFLGGMLGAAMMALVGVLFGPG